MKRSLASLGFRTLCLFVMVEGATPPQLLLAADSSAADSSTADAAKDTSAADSTPLETVRVQTDKLHVLPTEPVESVFGFGKNALETPRSVTSISNEMLDKVMITELDDMVALTPGSFTQSFFGVAGSLDIRGTPGENYFRGIRRIDNPGNYPQPIGASDRIDVVRGPATPIFGPSKVGGYLNFIPKSARAENGQYMQTSKGEAGVTTGRWDKNVLHAEIGGPAQLFGKPSGYYVYAEVENSGSYYQNTTTKQNIFQASFNTDYTDHLRSEFGGMYQDFKGNQVAGWNRLTQDLIDHGTYITGSPRSLDTNGNGLLDASEAAAGKISAFIFAPSTKTPAQLTAILAAHPNMALVNPGTTHINGNQVLVQPDDTLEDGVTTLYFDLIYQPAEGLKITNKSFFESLNNMNNNAYGFSQMAHTWAFEDQLIFMDSANFGGVVKANFQLSPQVRHQDYEHGDNFAYEFFDLRDITQIGSPIDRRSMATRGQELFSNHVKGKYTDAGLAYLMDVTFFEKLNLLGGARYDMINMSSRELMDALSTPGLSAHDTVRGPPSWSASLSYELPFGLRPYATRAKQSTMIVGQGGQIAPSNIKGGTAVAGSELTEYGIKGSFLDGHLYAAADYFDQKRTDYNAQDTVTNNTTKATGYEFEARWVATSFLTLTSAYTNLKVINLSALQNGTQFSFAGAADLPGVNPALMFGGAVPSIVLVPNEDAARKAGIPQNMYSVYGIFSFDTWMKGVTASLGATHVDSVWSGFSKTVKLPAYTLVNAGIHYETAKWKLGLSGKNLTNERYFRSNFPDLFGSSVVLPQLPRNYLITLAYRF
jgi:iron complex outermembrane recepter protein